MNWRDGRWNLYDSFTDEFTDGYKINYYFNLFRRWSVKNTSVIFEFRTKSFNDPPYFSWSVGKMRSEKHLMHNPLEFAQSFDNFFGNLPTDLYPSVVTSVIVAFQVIIFELSVNCRRTYSVGMDVGDCGISSNYFRTVCEMPTGLFRRYGRWWLWHFK
jgi:hypothetical protein